MSVFGDDTLEERILEQVDDTKFTDEQKIRALLRVASYINSGLDADVSTHF